MTKNKSGKQNDDSLDSIVKKIDDKNRRLAVSNHQSGKVYILYSALDGLNLSCTATKYGFDVLYTNSPINSSDAMHEWLVTPIGLVTTTVQATFIILFSIFGNYFDDEDPNFIKRSIATLFPYFRELKGLKNAYKGFRSAIQVFNSLTSYDANFLILPLALPLGSIAVVNRMLIRQMVNERKNMMKSNLALYKTIRNTQTISKKEYQWFFSQIERQTIETRYGAFISAIFSGAIDSFYLYVGILTISSFSWPVLAFMASCCIIYSLSCIASRLYEEYENQRKLKITAANNELALYSKVEGDEIDELFLQLQWINKQLAILNEYGKLSEEESIEYSRLFQQKQYVGLELKGKLISLNEKKVYVLALMDVSIVLAFLRGLKNGLAAYGALTSSLFFVSTLLLLLATPFPAALAFACVCTGLLLLIVLTSISLIQNFTYSKPNNNQHYEILWTNFNVLTDSTQFCNEDIALNVKESLKNELTISLAKQYFFQEWFEIFRSTFSGLSKGPKAIDYVMNFAQQMDDAGHYHDTLFMMLLGGLLSIVYSLSYALRAHARAFGKPPLNPIITEDSVQDKTPEVYSQEVEIELTNMNQMDYNTSDSFSVRNNFFKESSIKESGALEQTPGSREKRSSSLSECSFFNRRIIHQKPLLTHNNLESPSIPIPCY